ncbi:SpoIIE family protein phosphatase [Paracoccus sp. 1_MG-2023]|uniref:PP2C family protein-serine/threonine phosphatase n=1 Tax=unclassified Paracoccus (in: a-proteobacteria) TaxID=2688777 RepID=UPI001C09CB89|nr:MULTISPECIES: response regulator [unclassified Paracoccus (in: a-proteobacteria)]MBU2957047.1 SpoIIE family protein phosphatase [Paracoccus sp. C2R09]MDO6668245.1 SpoIIE family protein phosphatase [Paracoccus sp. 1_MG-2023]
MKAANRPRPSDADTTAHRPRHALLAGPADACRDSLQAMLQQAGLECTAAATGADAIVQITARHPDLLLSSAQLPDMTGLDLCRQFRAHPGPHSGYFLLLTSDRGDKGMAAGLAAGVDDFLSLPVARPELMARLAAAERMRRTEDDLRASNARLRTAMAQLSETQAAMERDLREARKLQQGLVRERSGRFGQLDISLLLRPAGHIGGDLVGFFPISGDWLGIYALDVSGHGVTAALLTAQLSVHLSSSSDLNVALRAAQGGIDPRGPGALAHFFNGMMLEEMNTDSYFTMIYAEMNHSTGQLRMVQAGHPHPVLQRADGSIEHLGRGGMPIGVFERPIFDELELQLKPGDRLLITSDGVTEAATPNGTQLGDEGLEAILRTNAFLSGHAFLESMAWSVSEYSRGERLDDVSAVLIEMRNDARLVQLSARPTTS